MPVNPDGQSDVPDEEPRVGRRAVAEPPGVVGAGGRPRARRAHRRLRAADRDLARAPAHCRAYGGGVRVAAYDCPATRPPCARRSCPLLSRTPNLMRTLRHM